MNNSSIKQGILQALPIVLGYLPLGFAFGVLARQVGLGPVSVFVMSLFVFAGSAQFISVSMLAAGSSSMEIIAATFLVNSRHLLMSAALAQHLHHFNKTLLAFVGFEITDETFAVAISNYQQQCSTPQYQLSLNLTAHTAWIVSTVMGSVVGNLIAKPEILGLNFALPAMFIGLLFLQLKNKFTVFIAIIAGMFSVLISTLIAGNWNIIIATTITATIGVIIEPWIIKSSY